MASFIGTTVSIDRTYLDTLIGRVQSHAGDDIPSAHPTITIARVEYDTLVKAAREFSNLRRNLMRGGVAEETLAVLTSDESNWDEDSARQQTDAPASADPQDATQRSIHKPQVTAVTAVRGPQGGPYNGKLSVPQSVKQGWADDEPTTRGIPEATASPMEAEHGLVHQEDARLSVQPQFERMATRTILISNLAEGTAHADVTDVVRGGQLLDIFLRTHDRSAQVSFLHASDARAFLEYTRRHDLYIRHKRVDVRWSERQFILPGHVASKIGIGATRNLVVRRCDPGLTEEGIRDDLEHIHNLVVVQVTFSGGSCHISTNSVHNAMFARTCMMSRQKYKRSRVEWDVDECAQPLEVTQTHRVQPYVLSSKQPMNPMANRFEVLKLDANDDDEENIPPGYHPQVSMDIMV
ncbi:uncharacterized protein LY79DRAFT_511301 [Colletotrichum navitas]|uniref:Negative regulator of differentiation 1 n=1 Tax=Colletotrichum navitas TaxID=681940 RepID=A0AAD8Q503_9PEZI|nr:uncharacterized protein LY79DRAFT_511301 [Colletotrichum navitas]KAK1595227.1 hypothetical protein LY79DRAFT_511301 [Colletotrichum navitas]